MRYLIELEKLISSYRTDEINHNPSIGCIVLSDPIFFRKEDWIPAPRDWAKSIVQGKGYSTEEPIGKGIWERTEFLIKSYQANQAKSEQSQFLLEDIGSPGYRESILTKVRLGQGAFRVLITDAYGRKCSISGEKTLPALEAAHIKPYAQAGPHYISNGLLLRADLHKLFDQGYITITQEYKIEISKRIKEEFENGKEYYKFHGTGLTNLPSRESDKPNASFLEWHNTNAFKS